MSKTTIRAIVGKYYKPITIEGISVDTVKVTFPFDRYLIDEIKNMEGARWNPEGKYWTVKKSQRNMLSFQYLSGNDPYAYYSNELIPYESKRNLFPHQIHMVRCGLTYRKCILACEQGTGKTLAAIEIMEASGFEDWLWVGPKNALRAVEMEFYIWKSRIWPRLCTYDSLKKYINDGTLTIPKGIVFDECQKIRNPTAQRSQAAQLITDQMRGKKNYIIEMSGTPAPNAPTDWWKICEVVAPGFLKEGNFEKFKRRMGLIIKKESIAGGTYPELVTWYDDENKCKICGKFKDDITHNIMYNCEHNFVPSENEVKKLYERLKGLTIIHFKKDVLKDLPEKNYRIIRAEPTESTLRSAQLIVASAKNSITASMLLRELSDGFQYKDTQVGTKLCSTCHGRLSIIHPTCIEWKCQSCDLEGDGELIHCPKCETPLSEQYKKYEDKEVDCPLCEGSGQIPEYDRQTIQIETPKQQVLIDLLEDHEDVGRLVVYGGFTGTVDRCVSICLEQKWHVVRVDGRGWWSSWNELNDGSMLKEFQKFNKSALDKIAFIGQPEAAGLGLTLTASPTIFYYSNSFKPEARSQSEDRIHRPGMDLNKGATIIDCFHLPSDEKIYEALKRKKRIQDISLGEFHDLFKCPKKSIFPTT